MRSVLQKCFPEEGRVGTSAVIGDERRTSRAGRRGSAGASLHNIGCFRTSIPKTSLGVPPTKGECV